MPITDKSPPKLFIRCERYFDLDTNDLIDTGPDGKTPRVSVRYGNEGEPVEAGEALLMQEAAAEAWLGAGIIRAATDDEVEAYIDANGDFTGIAIDALGDAHAAARAANDEVEEITNAIYAGREELGRLDEQIAERKAELAELDAAAATKKATAAKKASTKKAAGKSTGKADDPGTGGNDPGASGDA